MKLEIIKIHERGKPNEEFIELFVKETCNLNFYIIADNTYTGEMEISDKVRNTYWFRDYHVKKNDYIRLYTGNIKQSALKNNIGTYTHTFGWGLKKTIWNDIADCAVLFSLNGWTTSSYGG